MKFLKGFLYAFRGILYCINHERNMRIHTVAALYVLLFSPFFELSRGQYALLLLTMAGVMSAEAVNTSIEKLTDLCSPDYHPLARVAKDVAAGAVLVFAIFAVFVGICLLWQPAAFARIFAFFTQKAWVFALLLLTLPAVLLYIVKGPKGIWDMIKKRAR